jgi:tRNA(Ile)-lysidine synthase
LLSARRSHAPSAAQIDALFAPLARAKTLLVAVSGGPDSTALLIMAAEWARRHGKTRIEAATVDHRLRPESADEAKAVAALCARLGVAHRILEWKGAKPASRLQERAREARYRLLVDHAKAIGADAILTAHHADDQAETVLFRLLRGSGVAGLRGMDLTTTRDGMTIARPLIGLKKSALVAFAHARGAPFVDDPSNADPRFARTRLRALLTRLGEEGLDAEALDRLARRAGETEQALAHLTAEVEARLGADKAIDARALFAAPIAIVQRILSLRIAAAGGREPSRIGLEKIETLALGLRDALRERRAYAANVGGALVRLTVKGRLSFAPEPARKGGKRSAGHI